MRVLLSVTLLAVLPTSAAIADRRADSAKLRGELITAITRRDVAGVTSHVVLPLRLRNLRFSAPACTQFSGPKIEVSETELPELVSCLADLGVKDLSGVDDVFVNAVYGPGIPLVFSNAPGEQVSSLFSMSRAGSDLFVIEPVTFTSHIKKFKREVLPAIAMKKAIDASPGDHAVALVQLCVDGRGKVESVKATVPDEAFTSYEQDVTKAVRAWSIKPFVFGGKGVLACTTLSVGYPADRIGIPLQLQLPPPPPPPPPPPAGQEGGVEGSPPQNVAPTMLEGSRIAGEKVIVPDDKTKIAIQQSKRDRLIASFKLCVDTTGAVNTVTLLKTSGFPDYDAKIIREMNKWAYRPYQVNGQAVPVCSAVTFIYSQK